MFYNPRRRPGYWYGQELLQVYLLLQSIHIGSLIRYYSIDSDAITAAGFGFLADGSDVGGPRAKGHRSITVKTPVSEAALQQGLNNINESPGPGILQWTKLPRTAAPAAKPAAP